MKPACIGFLVLSVATTLSAESHPGSPIKPLAGTKLSIGKSHADPAIRGKVVETYDRLPLVFEVNQGQSDPQVKFLSRGAGYSLFLTPTGAVLTLARVSRQEPGSTAAKDLLSREERFAVLGMELVGANAKTQLVGQDELPGKSNYFIGNNPAQWRRNVPTYAKVKYEGIYPGIDLVYYGNQRQLEYDFIVAPGADPHRIEFDVRGAQRIRRDERGDLVLKMGEGEIRWHKPTVYQEKGGARQEIAAHYSIAGANRVGFALAKYDASRPLYIDPLIYSTYLGGSGLDNSSAIAVDSAGNAYVTGWTTSVNFPTKNPLQGFHTDFQTTFVTKINPAGSALVYSTYLGGSVNEIASGIAVDSAGNAFVTGQTSSPDFPTMNPLQSSFGGGADVFVAEINSAGSALVYSTYLGGSSYDEGDGIAVDSAGNTYVAGSTQSADFPTTPGVFQTTCNRGGECVGSGDAFVAKIGPAGSALVYSTYLGGSTSDIAHAIAVDSAGDVYVTGGSFSTDFPTLNPVQAVNAGSFDAFVAKLNPAGSALIYSTYLGGGGYDPGGLGIAIDGAGNAYVTGHTESTDFPTTLGAFQTTCHGCDPINHTGDAFAAKLTSNGVLVYSTFLGGGGTEWGTGIAVDSAGNAYVTGFTSSTDFPTMNPLQNVLKGVDNAFVSRLNPTGSALLYSTYLGGSGQDAATGIALDNAFNSYIAGGTNSGDFPTNLLQQTYGGGLNDAFVAKIDVRAVTTIAFTSSPNPSTFRQSVTFTATLTSSLGAPPDGATVTFMKGKTVLGTGALSGGLASLTISKLKVGTNLIKAVYGGDSNFDGSTSKALSQVVSKATTTTTLASSQNPSNFGQAVTFSASVAPQFNGTTVTGTMTFYDGTTAMMTVSLSKGAAKFTTSALAAGTHTITATYNGGTNFIGSSASLTQTVN
jgi:Big-like domain-containing protein/beta-propeller repeat-containing protein